jgi:hypothetical protein
MAEKQIARPMRHAAAHGGTTGLTSLGFTNSFPTTVVETDTFTLLTARGGLSGAFSNVANGERLAAIDGLGSFQVNYGAGSAFAASIGANASCRRTSPPCRRRRRGRCRGADWASSATRCGRGRNNGGL